MAILVGNQQILFDKSRRRRQTNKIKDSTHALINLFLKRLNSILNNIKLWMSNPCINEFFIKFNGFLDCLISWLFRCIVIETLCSISRRYKMNYCLISFISQLNCTPPRLIQYSLPSIFVRICTSIHHSSITKYNCWHFTWLSNFHKNIFQLHLKSH